MARRDLQTLSEPFHSLRTALVDHRPVLDAHFDRLYPEDTRLVSSWFWTPCKVALQAALWLTTGGAKRVLDVGAGVGKFCIVGGLSTGAEFVGIEHRADLVAIAIRTIARLEAHSAKVVEGDFQSLLWCEYDAFYFYNPFQENLSDTAPYRLDHNVEMSHARHVHDTQQARLLLEGAPAGTRVATYYGVGFDMPPSYQLALQPKRAAHLEFYTKV